LRVRDHLYGGEISAKGVLGMKAYGEWRAAASVVAIAVRK